MKFYPTLDETLAKRFEPHTEDGLSEVRDISNHGIDAGFSGFLYYHETTSFFNEFEFEIEERLDDMGYTMSDLVDDNPRSTSPLLVIRQCGLLLSLGVIIVLTRSTLLIKNVDMALIA